MGLSCGNYATVMLDCDDRQGGLGDCSSMGYEMAGSRAGKRLAGGGDFSVNSSHHVIQV